jgi:hypothetical protein
MMEDFLDFTNFKQLNNNVMSDKPKRVYKMGVYMFNCTGYKMSSEIEGYNKTPFTKLIGNDENGQTMEVMIWHQKPADNENVVKIKKEIANKLFTNLGVDTNILKGKEVLEGCIGKQCKVAMKERERFGTNKDGKPMIYTDALYWYSGEADKELTFDASKAKILLSNTDRTRFLQAQAQYESTQGGGDSIPDTQTPESNDDLPW